MEQFGWDRYRFSGCQRAAEAFQKPGEGRQDYRGNFLYSFICAHEMGNDLPFREVLLLAN